MAVWFGVGPTPRGFVHQKSVVLACLAVAAQVIVLDDEAPRDHVFGDFLTHVHPYPQVAFQPDPGDLFPSKICGRSKGYDRQMWSGCV